MNNLKIFCGRVGLFLLALYVSAAANATVTYVLTDHLGSIIAESNSAGQITKRFHYKPFGDTIEVQQDDAGYTGHKHDADLGMTYMQARYYDPVLGRFMQPDPIGSKDDMDLYAYVGNDPLNKTDPTGLCPVCVLAWIYANAEILTVGTVVGVEIAAGAPTPVSVMESTAARTIASETKTLAQRASEIHKAVPAATQSRTTISVTSTVEGINVVASSEKTLRPAQRAMLQEGEVAATGVGHAEVTGVNAAKEMGLTPLETAASRPICEACQNFLKQVGVDPASILKTKTE